MFGIGGGAGLVLAGLFVDHGSISWIFWLSVATTALAALATWLWVPESPVRVRARIDWVGGALLSLTLLALLLAHQRGQHVGLDLGRACSASSPPRRSSPSSGRAWELRVVDPLVDLALMRQRPVWTTNVAGLRHRLRHVRLVRARARSSCRRRPSAGYGFGASVTASGLFLLPSALLMLFAGPLSGRLGARYGSRVPLALGALSSGLSYAWLAALPRRAHRHLPRRASCSASASGSRWRRWPISSSRPSRPT